MSKHQKNKNVFYDIRPPYGAVFQPNVDGSVKLVFNVDEIDNVEKWVNGLTNTFSQIVTITKQQIKMAESPLDRPVKLAIKGPGVADLPHNKVIDITDLDPISESQILSEEK